MVIEGGARGRPVELALHLQRTDHNERVNLFEMWGIDAPNLYDALREIHAIGAGARSARTLYHANIDPRENEQFTEEQKRIAVRRLAEKMGFENQPRVVVEHVKKGRHHLHVVFGRIDLETMTAIPDSHNYRKHEELATELSNEFGHAPVRRALTRDREKEERVPQAPSFAEHQQAGRSGLKPAEAKAIVSNVWQSTTTGREFQQALEAEGFTLAQGDRRDFVLVDAAGEIHGLTRRIEGAKAKDVRERMADVDGDQLPDVEEARRQLKLRQQALELETVHEFTSAAELVTEEDEQRRPAWSSFEREAGAAVAQLRKTMGADLGGVVVAQDRRTADKTPGQVLHQSESIEDRRARELEQRKAENLERAEQRGGAENPVADPLQEKEATGGGELAPPAAVQRDQAAAIEADRQRSVTPKPQPPADEDQAQPKRTLWQRMFGRKPQAVQEAARSISGGMEVAGTLPEATQRPSVEVEKPAEHPKQPQEQQHRPSFHLFVRLFGAIIEAYQHAVDRHNIERAKIEESKRQEWRSHANDARAAAPQRPAESRAAEGTAEDRTPAEQQSREEQRKAETARALRKLREQEDRDEERERENQLRR